MEHWAIRHPSLAKGGPPGWRTTEPAGTLEVNGVATDPAEEQELVQGCGDSDSALP